jgi:hypothetical protein
LCTKVSFHVSYLLLVSTGQSEIGKGVDVHREVADGSTVFGGHITNGCTIGDGEAGDTRSVEFDEFFDDTRGEFMVTLWALPLFTESSSDGEYQIGCGSNGRKFSGQLDTNNFRKNHGNLQFLENSEKNAYTG